MLLRKGLQRTGHLHQRGPVKREIRVKLRVRLSQRRLSLGGKSITRAIFAG